MNVTVIHNKQLPDGGRTRSYKLGAEELRFFALVALNCLGPAAFCCAIIGDWWPLWFMTTVEALGAALGFMMYKRPFADFPACVPLASAADIRANAALLSKAA